MSEISPILLIQGATRATARQITITGATLTDNGGGSVDLAISGGGGGGLWTASGYTGTANYGAGFNGSGAAAVFDLSLFLSVATAVVDFSAARWAFCASFIGHVCLGADNRFNSTFGALFIKIDNAIHVAVICDS